MKGQNVARKTKWHTVRPFRLKYALFTERPTLKKFLEGIGTVEPQHTPECFSAICRVYSNGMQRFCCVEMGNLDGMNELQIMMSIVHESVHVFQEACVDVHEEKPSDELEAYSIEKISLNLLQDYADYTASQKKRKKKGRKRNGKRKLRSKKG